MWPAQPAKVQQVSAFNNFFGSVVGIQNALLAPLAPFGRKLSQYGHGQGQQQVQDATFVDTLGNTQTNPVSYAALPSLSCTASRNPRIDWCQGGSWDRVLLLAPLLRPSMCCADGQLPCTSMLSSL